MNDNLTTNASNEAESPAFLVGAVMRSAVLDEQCPTNDYKQGKPQGKCWGDGHYLCQSCKWYRADFKKHGQDYIDAAHNAQHGLQFSILSKHDA